MLNLFVSFWGFLFDDINSTQSRGHELLCHHAQLLKTVYLVCLLFLFFLSFFPFFYSFIIFFLPVLFIHSFISFCPFFFYSFISFFPFFIIHSFFFLSFVHFVFLCNFLFFFFILLFLFHFQGTYRWIQNVKKTSFQISKHSFILECQRGSFEVTWPFSMPAVSDAESRLFGTNIYARSNWLSQSQI